MKMGVMFDFRNPDPWRRPYPQFYQTLIDEIVRMEELGFDNCWLKAEAPTPSSTAALPRLPYSRTLRK